VNILAGPMVLLAGSIAIGCGTIAEAINPIRGGSAYFVGIVLLLTGGVMLMKPLWDAIPVDGGQSADNKSDREDTAQ